MKIAFFTGSEFTLPLLSTLIQLGYSPVIVTKPVTILRGKPQPQPIVLFAQKHNLSFFTPSSYRDYSSDQLKEVFGQCETGIVASYGKILPKRVLDMFPLGVANWHPSLLPHYRGPTPAQTAIAKGETTTALTWIRMNEKMDEGNVLIQQKFAITPYMTTEELLNHAVTLGCHTLPTILNALRDRLPGKKQDPQQATYTKVLTKQDACIDPSVLSASSIYNHVRAYKIFPKTEYIDLSYGKVRLLEVDLPVDTIAKISSRGNLVQDDTKKTYLSCAEGYLPVKTIMLSTGKTLNFSGVQF